MADTSFLALTSQLELAETLRLGKPTMLQPQDLPGRYGRVVKAIDRVLLATGAEAVIGGGWAVWRHGYVGRVTQDIDIVLPADVMDEFLQAAGVSGFEALPVSPGRWPKLMHKETGIQVDLLPEGQRPGTTSRPAPTTIPHPATIGAETGTLRYITLPALMELKIAAGRAQDEADVIKLIAANPNETGAIKAHLARAHPDYVERFEQLSERAREESD